MVPPVWVALGGECTAGDTVAAVQLTPRYEPPTILRIDVPIGDPAVPLLRQRRRLADTLAGLTEAQWSAPSRCEGWTVKDVVAHLADTNQFWAISISSGLAGSPTRFLAAFDPVATPASMVEATSAQSSSEVLARYRETLDGLAAVVTGVDDDAWSRPGEAPPGHIALRAVALHAMWDGWTHERDIAEPLGLPHTEEPDEITGSLLYSAAISPALLASQGSTRRAVLAVEATGPDTSFVVDAGSSVVVRPRTADDAGCAELRGAAVDLVEGLTFRAPLDHDVPAADQWVLGGLAAAFDRSG
jgi:uncharacterized protein (TIGR03083 family)